MLDSLLVPTAIVALAEIGDKTQLLALILAAMLVFSSVTPTPDDNRITFGCINVPQAFYTRQLRPTFRRKGGYVYILPDTKPIEEVFPRLRTQLPG